MLKMRKQVMKAFRQMMLEQFEDEMVLHLRSAFPKKTEAADDEQLRALVRKGIARADGYEVVLVGDVQRYLEYMVDYGEDFDRDPTVSWAGQILRTDGIDGTEKMDRLDDHVELEQEGLA